MSGQERIRLSVTLPADLHAELQRSAKEHERSLNREIVWALRFHVDLAASRPDAKALIERLADQIEKEEE